MVPEEDVGRSEAHDTSHDEDLPVSVRDEGKRQTMSTGHSTEQGVTGQPQSPSCPTRYLTG